MKIYSIRANVRVDGRVTDRDAWAVDLVEGSSLSEQLKAGWFWATWPDRVEFVFSIRADENSIEQYSSEIEQFLSKAPHIVGRPELSVEERRGNEA